MKTFLIVVVCLFILDVVGKVVFLWKRDFVRSPGHIATDIVIGLVLFGWGMWLLGSNGGGV